MNPSERSALERKAREIRGLTIEEIGYLGVGHIGGAMSIVDLLVLLYHRHMRIDPANPAWPDRDRLVLSKGHAGPALYAVLADKSFFPIDWLLTLNRGGTSLPSHCDRTKTPGVDMTTGSLGQGLSTAAGLALARAMDGAPGFVYCIIGDGESNEGQIWEAAMFAAHRRLSNLIVFADWNGMQIDGYTREVMDMDDITAKWTSFGWHACMVDGHDFDAMDAAIQEARERATPGRERPSIIILKTIKGKGCSFCEGQVSNHNMTYGIEQTMQALQALGVSPRLIPELLAQSQ
ncbi:MAG: transketolase [Spirochaetales bacterium]|nr:transketolase [Spirochaetales bacterium]